MEKGRVIAVSMSVVVFLAAAFWFLDLRVASSETGAQAQWSTVSFGRGNPADPGDGLALYITGNNGISETLSAGLRQSLQTTPGIGPTDLLTSLPSNSHRPTLVVESTGTDGIWTPVYARSALHVHVSYASNGDLSWRGKPIIARSDEGPGIFVDGEIAITDVTRGVVSHRAYERYLGEQLGGEVGKLLAQAYPTKTGGIGLLEGSAHHGALAFLLAPLPSRLGGDALQGRSATWALTRWLPSATRGVTSRRYTSRTDQHIGPRELPNESCFA